MDLKNKVAIVTGGGSGLGGAAAIKLAEGGAKVAVLDLNADGLRTHPARTSYNITPTHSP